MRMSHAWRWLLSVGLLGGLLFLALRPVPLRVDGAVLGHGPIQLSFQAEGQTRVRDRFEISAPILAQIRRITLEPGDIVHAGQTLVLLDPARTPTLDARATAQAEARIAAAQARLDAITALADSAFVESERLLSEYHRLLRLFEQGMASDDQMDRILAQKRQSERQAASARYEQAAAQHELAAAAAVLSHGGKPDAELPLLAPVDGMVLRRFAESARTVQPGEVLLEIGDPTGLEVAVDVLSANAVRLRENTAVELLRWGGNTHLQAIVRRIEPAGFTKISALGIEEQRVWVIVDLLSPREEWQRLGDGFRVNARFILDERSDALRVPHSALFRTAEGRDAVFRIEQDRVMSVPVITGLHGDQWVEVIEGLAVGDRIVLYPPRELSSGQRVRW